MTTPTPDLVRELRDASASGESSDWLRDIAARAADEVERLRAQVAPAGMSVERAESDGALIGWRLTLGDSSLLVWADQDAMPGFRVGNAFVPRLGEVVTYSASPAAPAQQAEPDWLYLKAYGYAPGGYMGKCHRCEKVVEFIDKRATTCRPCAEALHAERSAQQADSPCACWPGRMCSRSASCASDAKAQQAAQSSTVVDEPAAAGNWTPFIQHVQTVADGGSTWPDEYLEWLQPHLWLNEERAVAAFLGDKLRAALAEAQPAAQGMDDARDAARYRWWRDSPDSPIANEPRATDAWVDAAMAASKEQP